MSRKVSLYIVAGVLCLAAEAVSQTNNTVTAQVAQSSNRPPLVLQLNQVVEEALRNNPAVQSAFHTAQAERRRVPQAGSLPDPKLSLNWMGNITPFSVQTNDPSSYRGISAMQELPFPGKRKLRSEIAGKDADASQSDYDAVRRRLVADVKAAYYEYWYYDKAVHVTLQNKDLLQKLSQIAESRYRVGKGIQQDVLKSQVELSLLLQKLTMLQQQRATAAARLSTLLARPPEQPLPPPANIAGATPLNYSLDQLYELADRTDPSLRREQRMVEHNQLAVNLAHKDYYPDLAVGYMYQQRPLLPDMHGFTFTVNIPVFYKSKQRQELAEASEQAAAAEKSRQNRQNELNFEVKQQYLTAKASQELLQLYSQGVVPQSSLALESSMSAYQVGTVDFLSVLTNFSTVLNYQTDYYRELANYQTALAQLESLTGAQLTSAPARPDEDARGGKE
jgi:cobalt-zinc-cadmium efflux system outer membrane protein